MRNKNNYSGFFAIALMLFMIFDAKNVMRGAIEGIRLCFSAVVPSLFPFLVLSSIINNIAGGNLFFLRFVGKFCRIPSGVEYTFLLSFIGGYPIGAQNAQFLYNAGAINKKEASRLLAFSNNPGPAFIFGMAATLFPSPLYAWIIWIIIILSAIITARIIPGEYSLAKQPAKTAHITVTDAMRSGLIAIANICGWVIIFRILITLIQYRILYKVPIIVQVIFTGILELSNGIMELNQIENLPLRFILCCGMLSCGGLCVCMQTKSVAKALSMQQYYIGKFIQFFVSLFLAVSIVPFLFQVKLDAFFIGSIILCILIIVKTMFFKKRVAISGKLIYNIRKS